MKHLLKDRGGRWCVATKWDTDAFGNRFVVEYLDVHDDVVEQREDARKESGSVHAVGTTPEECIAALAVVKGWGAVEDLFDLTCSKESGFAWGRTFTAGGTSFKAAGRSVPGGFILTWWK